MAERQQWICTGQELEAGFTDDQVDASYKWGDPRRYAMMVSRLQRIEAAAREVVRAYNEHESVTQADIDALESALAERREGE